MTMMDRVAEMQNEVLRAYPDTPEFWDANNIAFQYFATCRGDKRSARDARFYMLRDDIYQALIRTRDRCLSTPSEEGSE